MSNQIKPQALLKRDVLRLILEYESTVEYFVKLKLQVYLCAVPRYVICKGEASILGDGLDSRARKLIDDIDKAIEDVRQAYLQKLR